jgi:DNA-binding response OmpR family regulator
MPTIERLGRRILVLEDEWLIANTLAEQLIALGCEVVGPASTVASALQLIADGRLDAALLDVALGKDMSFPVATALRRLGVPFAFLTGYVDVDLPVDFRDELIISKPVGDLALESALDNLLSKSSPCSASG